METEINQIEQLFIADDGKICTTVERAKINAEVCKVVDILGENLKKYDDRRKMMNQIVFYMDIIKLSISMEVGSEKDANQKPIYPNDLTRNCEIQKRLDAHKETVNPIDGRITQGYKDLENQKEFYKDELGKFENIITMCKANLLKLDIITRN